MAALEDQHKYHRVFLHLTGHSNLKQTYRVNDECQMKLIQAVGEKHSVRISLAFFSRLKYQLLPVQLPLALVFHISSQSLLRERVVLPPGHERSHGRDRQPLLAGYTRHTSPMLASGKYRLLS